MATTLPRVGLPARLMALIVAMAALVLASAAVAGAAPRWAPENRASIHPGVQTFTAGAQCTANFVFYDRRDVYIGQAAHCSGSDDSEETNGCLAHSLPLNTKITVGGARYPGRLAYNSWVIMRARAHERDVNTCADNDLALIRLDRRDRSRVNPTIPRWGGPTGLAYSTREGQDIFTYGNSELRNGVTTLSPKRGYSLGTTDGGWSHTVYTVTPGIPGDSGSALIDDRGLGFGVLSTVAFAPLTGSNGVGDLRRELRYLGQHTRLRVTLARGTRGFHS
jgi:hypothetical protein